MPSYANYFIGGDGQLAIIVGALALMAGFSFLGGAVGGRERFREGDFLYGWAIANVVLIVPGVFLASPFLPAFWVMVVAMGLAGVFVYRREGRLLSVSAVKVVLIGLPLIVLASARMASEWDEFSHWVPTALYIFEQHGLPLSKAVSAGQFPGYPFGWLILTYFANTIAGQFVESAGALLNVLLLYTFGLAAVSVGLRGANKDPSTWNIPWALAAAAVMAGTMLNPTFAQKVVVTTYADASSAVAMGFGAILGWLIVEALSEKNLPRARQLAWQFGLVMLVLINIKQANLVLFVVLLAGIWLAGLRDPAIRLADLVRLLPAMILPAALIYSVWQYHVTENLPRGSAALLRPFEDWNIHLIDKILLRMLLVASKKGVYFGIMAVALVAAVSGLLRCRSPFHRLSIIIGTAFFGYNAFLLLIFVAQFGEFDALRVASYWRYNMHLGLLAVVFGAYVLGMAWRKYLSARTLPRGIYVIPLIVVLVAPLVFAKKIRFDLEPQKPYYRSVGRQVPDLLPPGARLVILDPRGTGESMILTRFELRARRSALLGYRAQYDSFKLEPISTLLKRTELTHLLVHSVVPTVQAVTGLDLKQDTSFFLEKTGPNGTPGEWRIVKSWPHPEGMRN